MTEITDKASIRIHQTGTSSPDLNISCISDDKYYGWLMEESCKADKIAKWIDFLDTGRDVEDLVTSQHTAADTQLDLGDSLLSFFWPWTVFLK